MSKRLLIHVEGQTEEEFVNSVLAGHLCNKGYVKVDARIVGHARRRDRRGGIRGWNSVRNDVLNHLKSDPGCIATTMVDFYALPQTGAGAWPGRAKAATLAFAAKAVTVEEALKIDICNELGDDFNPNRFIPFVMMHEFESMLFSDCKRFSHGICQIDLGPKFQAIRDKFQSPEEINDSPLTAPSKRIEALIPGYEKPLLGALAALEIGLDAIRRECPHFRSWLERLEA